jgi:hypothetical protein
MVNAPEMLTLAAITYRGMLAVGTPAYKRKLLRRLMDESVSTFDAVKGRWKIVWGPASFSPVSIGVDDALMYVAQSLVNPAVLAIAIRGTNTVSLSDWVFGDLIIRFRVPWPYDDAAKAAGAMISESTALGISILQNLKWSESEITAQPAVNPPAAAAQETTGDQAAPSLASWAQSIKARRANSGAANSLESALPGLEDFSNGTFNPISILGRGAASSQPADGETLLSFLTRHVGAYRGAEVIVTGHSKGGALCSTLALWLADTRGKNGSWNPDRNAPVSAWSFAGPTAGNGQFAAHSDRVLTTACHRIWNIRDLVPYAFVSDLMLTFPSNYQLDPIDKGILENVVETAARLDRPLDYQQICGGGTPLDCPQVPNKHLVTQFAYQHLDGYLEKLKLSDQISFAGLIKPQL